MDLSGPPGLGQWVVQEYSWNIGTNFDELSAWRMMRWHVDPKIRGTDALGLRIT